MVFHTVVINSDDYVGKAAQCSSSRNAEVRSPRGWGCQPSPRNSRYLVQPRPDPSIPRGRDVVTDAVQMILVSPWA